MIRDLMDVELARQLWEDGRRQVERAAPGSADSRRLAGEVELVVAELRRRVGQTFTLEELADAYDGAAEWAQELLYDARPEDVTPPDTGTVTGAAFDVYAHGASDYRP